MHILVNERSFIGQAPTVYDAPNLMRALMDVLKALKPLQGSEPISTHSSLFQRELSPAYTVDEWARAKSAKDRDIRTVFIVLVRKGPHIDKLLNDELEYHECHFNEQDVATSSIAGAAYFKGVLASLQGAPEFAPAYLPVKFSTDGQSYQDIEIPNLTDAQQISNVRRKYVPSPKHDPLGGWDSPMDLDDSVAQIVLDNGIPDGKQVYSQHSGKFYVFQPDNVGGYHGYLISKNDVPAKVLRRLLD
jgi:hypothetical protein